MMLIRFLFLVLISSIQSCPLKTVDIRQGCYCGIEIDGTNYIQCHSNRIYEMPQFTRSYIHEKLNISQNFIENLTNQSFEHLKVKRIYLETNPIRSIDKQTFNHHLLHYLEELYIETIVSHSLEFLCYGTWKKLRILKLTGFNINQFEHCLENLDRLEKLTIEKSEINLVTYHIYKLPFLFELSLINNQLKELTFDFDSLSYSSSIRILNLTSNQLQTIPTDLNRRLPHLTTLDLSHNHFETIPTFNHQTTLNVNLTFNFINYIQIDQQHFFDLSFNPICTLERLTTTNIRLHNPTKLHCDCRLAFFLENNASMQSSYFDNETICSSPDKYQGVHLSDLTYEQLMDSCSIELPQHCKEISNFKELVIENSTECILTKRDVNESVLFSFFSCILVIETTDTNDNMISSFRLTSFYTIYENDDLLIFWDFDQTPYLSTKLQITIEQNNEIIRRSDYFSPFLKQYMISHLSSNKNYYVCLLMTRVSFGTDKYCRETRTSTQQTFRQILFVNRSLIFGFLVGTILTTSLLLTVTFICHLKFKRKHDEQLIPLSRPKQQQHPRYMYVNRNDSDGTYSHSILSSSSSSSKYQHLNKQPPQQQRRTYLTPIPPWYYRNSRASSVAANPRSPCCFLQYHQRTLSDCTTTNPSDYSNSNGIEKEQVTSTSFMSNMSLDEPTNSIIQNSFHRHVYEELADANMFLYK